MGLYSNLFFNNTNLTNHSLSQETTIYKKTEKLVVRKVNFSLNGEHTAIYVDGILAIHTTQSKIDGIDDSFAVTPSHIEIWIEGLFWGLGDYKKNLDWLTVDCLDKIQIDKFIGGSSPPYYFRDLNIE